MLVATAAQGAGVDFGRDIRPLLADRCFKCHGPDALTRQADLRLDVPDNLIERGILNPEDPEASELVVRVATHDPDLVMPPPAAKMKPISEAERKLLLDWIASGAEYKQHWAFVAPTPPTPPETGQGWARGAIDQFVAARLEEEGLKPSPEADRATLIRRLYLDLTGLPPSAEEVEQFVADNAPDAYEKLVDRLLTSPHFGERMALEWLDAARYADTNGYSIDGGRHMWLWRDWVINAYNTNMPYDQFLIEQIAGDLLPGSTPAQKIASGFQRNNMNTHEGGTIPEENIVNYNADRVKTLGEAVLGLTLGCAQCHDHKYDPTTQRDYYQLYAYFNTIGDVGLDGDAGVNSRPYFNARTVLQTGEEPALRERIARLEKELHTIDPEQLAAWETDTQRQLAKRGKDLSLVPLRMLKASTPNTGEGYHVEGERYLRVTSKPGLLAYDVVLEVPPTDQPITGLRLVFYPDPDSPEKIMGGGNIPEGAVKQVDPLDSVSDPVDPATEAAPAGTFMVTTVSVSGDRVPSDQVNLHQEIHARGITASSWLGNFRPENALDTTRTNGWSPRGKGPEPEWLTLTFDNPIDPAANRYLTASVHFGYGWGLIARKFEVQVVQGADDGTPFPPAVLAALETPAADRTSEHRQAIEQHYIRHAPALSRLRIDLANARERLAVLTREHSTMIMAEAEKPRKTHILTRGDYSQPAEEVTPALPAFLPREGDFAPNRLGLAEWITCEDHPLTARVAVNRLWQIFFGRGLVATPADFGLQGEFPSHPELLDWLAIDFVDSGWDVKRAVRQIVLSSTYRQDSTSTPEQLERDPDNRLLARGPRFRLSAELVRDVALKQSGLLVPLLGGPSVNPYTPGDLWREISHYGSSPASAQTFVQDHGEKLYRRSLYTYWKRTVPPPNMAAFDAPTRETCTVLRSTTTTPLQALIMLNDVQFVEAARHLAERMWRHDTADKERLRWAFAECLSREPSPEEVAVLAHCLETQRVRYAADTNAAAKLVSVGESLRDESIPVTEHAAFTQVATLLLNLSENVTRN
jgi:hypothetical protein